MLERVEWRAAEAQSAESANVLFRGGDYCRLVVSSHFALIDSKFQEGIGFSLACSHVIDSRITVHPALRIEEKVWHAQKFVCC